MANPSSVYVEDENARQTLANGAVIKWTKQLQNIHALNGETDLSIAYTNWANEPMMTRANRGFHQWQGGCVSGGDLGYNQSTGYTYQHASGIKQLEGGQPRIDSLQSHVVLSNGGGYYVWGYNPEASTRISGSSGDQRRYLLDMDINKMLFSCTITVVDKSFFDNVDYTTNPENMPAPSEHSITLKELYTHPELYYCTGSISWANTYVYGEDTSDHWRGATIRPSIILTGESIGEFQGANDSIFGSFTSNGSFSYDSRDPNAHANFGGGGSSNTLYNRMNAGYFMGCNNEIDMTPTDTFDSAGGMSTSIALAKWGNTNFSKFVYCNGQIFDYGDSVIWCAWGCRVVNNTDTGAIYRDYTFGTRRYIKADKMLKYIASFGLYFMSESFDPDTVSLTPETLGDDSRIMLGEMIDDGTTTGRWITDIDSYHGPNKDGKTSNPYYDPSGGGGGGSQDDDPWNGVDFGGTGAGGGGAFCSVYYMTGAELTSLKSWGMTSAPEGFDMLPSIIGLHQVPVALSGVPTTVKFLKSAAITESGDSRLVDTGVSAGTGTGAPIDFSLGSVNINRRMQQRGEPYLDYDCTVELYLPFAGIFQLDTQAVMGRTISAKITLDPVNGTVFAYAWVENNGEKMPIAYGGGPIAVSLPVSSNQWGLSRAAAQQMKHQQIQNVLNIAKDAVLSWAGGKMAQNINRMGFSTNVDAQIAQYGTTQGLKYQSVQQGSNIIESTANTVQGIHNLVQLNNTNYTAVNGSFGGSYAEWSQPFTAYVRITRPKFQKPSNYNHTQAVPCVEAKTVGSCTGLVQCINPDIDSIPCTQTEKVLITNALVNGVYAGGGGQ